MTPADAARERRIAEIVGAVARQALADRGARRIALLDDGGPEAELAARLLSAALGPDAVVRVAGEGVESVLHAPQQVAPVILPSGDADPRIDRAIHGSGDDDREGRDHGDSDRGEDQGDSDRGDADRGDHDRVNRDRTRWAEETRRMRARLMDGALPAHPANKTVLLLGGELPPEPLLPLGDLWASEVAALAGGWSAPDEVRRLAEAAGGIAALDAALRALIDGRGAAALDALPAAARDEVRRRLAAGRASRIFPRVVPKLGSRTLGVDLFE